MKIAIGSDHAAFDLKGIIKAYLDKKGIPYEDFGTYSNESVDYPVYGEKVARAVTSGKFDRGIALCGSGIGMSVAVNKIHGVRCVVCSEPYSAVLSRKHNDTNILAMGARVVGPGLAEMIVEQWLNAEFEGGRHQQRVDMITKLDKKR